VSSGRGDEKRAFRRIVSADISEHNASGIRAGDERYGRVCRDTLPRFEVHDEIAERCDGKYGHFPYDGGFRSILARDIKLAETFLAREKRNVQNAGDRSQRSIK
jgi:hypothetical protein